MTSAGRRIDPLGFHGEGLVRTDIWDAVPALRTLELEGAFLFHSVDHEHLTTLRVRGPVISDGSVFAVGRTPALASLAVEIPVAHLDAQPGDERLDLGRGLLDSVGLTLELDSMNSPRLATVPKKAVIPSAFGAAVTGPAPP
ncbi:hypothetical protein AB0D08_14875 [Kitasatospora sp. NPDC048540]|uniref:hypothetical protein n=1 Tax=Kitasatospora sp. NPDC048540 TaxID=3155634 RepID=UPI00340B5F88